MSFAPPAEMSPIMHPRCPVPLPRSTMPGRRISWRKSRRRSPHDCHHLNRLIMTDCPTRNRCANNQARPYQSDLGSTADFQRIVVRWDETDRFKRREFESTSNTGLQAGFRNPLPSDHMMDKCRCMQEAANAGMAVCLVAGWAGRLFFTLSGAVCGPDELRALASRSCIGASQCTFRAPWGHDRGRLPVARGSHW